MDLRNPKRPAPVRSSTIIHTHRNLQPPKPVPVEPVVAEAPVVVEVKEMQRVMVQQPPPLPTHRVLTRTGRWLLFSICCALIGAAGYYVYQW